VSVKRAMIEWVGPIVYEYYNATEAIGGTAIDADEWLAHPGSVGKAPPSAHILDDDFNELPRGVPGTIWFEPVSASSYHDDDEKTKAATSPQGYRTVGDVGFIDDDGYLFLTDRATFMIVSGGVNIYPQEIEAVLFEHPELADCAVFGIPNEEFGEEVKAVVQPRPGVTPGPDLGASVIAFCKERLASYKCPRSVEFVEEMPRDPSGKLYKKRLRDPYWPDGLVKR
jgi:acyl-CoA synthetase (AMP-forming)/AMP-acid ligase II